MSGEQTKHRGWPILIGILVMIALIVLSPLFGAVTLAPTDVIDVFKARLFSANRPENASTDAIVWLIRMPRALLTAICGAGLALVGVSMQAITRNPLADPYLFGTAAGGAVGAVLALLYIGPLWGTFTVPIFAFLGASCAGGTVLALGRSLALMPERFVLIGVAVAFLAMAIANLLIFLGDPRGAPAVIFWMFGSLGLAEWSQLLIPVTLLAVSLIFFFLNATNFNAITLGDETATSLGIDPARFRLLVFIVGAMLTGALVAVSGLIGFIGLMVPHIARRLVGGDHALLLFAAPVIGAITLLVCDIFARSIAPPQDVPIGIVTGAVGGAFFIWMLLRGNDRGRSGRI